MGINLQRYQKVIAKFNPKRLETLKDEAKPYIGKELILIAAWPITKEDGGDYVGQWAFTGFYKNLGWIPEEDLDDIKILDREII